MKYTEKQHAKALLNALKKPNVCYHCPPTLLYGPKLTKEIHAVCRKFIGISNESWTPCPCHFLGKQEAIKRTWIALEEKGYI